MWFLGHFLRHLEWAVFGCLAFGPVALFFRQYLIGFALLALPTGLALLIATFIAMMWISSRTMATRTETTPANTSKYIRFNDAKLKAKYENKRIPMEILFESYIKEKIDFIGDLHTAMLHREEFASFVFTWGNVSHFLFGLLPEVFDHRKMSHDVLQVREHYDRGNDFFRAFLGPRMIYTSAVFNDASETLEQGQDNKMKLVCEKVHLKTGEKHLDIGCGWGTLTAFAAKNFGSDSTGVTLARNQTEYGMKQIEEMGVSDRARILCCDYRDIPAQKYNKITCLEMAEHVGVINFQSFLAQVRDMMTDDGLFFLQIAGLRRYWRYEDLIWGLFMGKYIFPGADASCPLGWVVDQLEMAGFEIRSSETIGIHYSATLKYWYDNWVSNKDAMVQKYGQWWFRLFHIFLSWSTIISGNGGATCFQLVCHKNTHTFDRRQFIGHRP